MAAQLLRIDDISFRLWKNTRGSKNPPRGYLWINHGLGEHSGRYESLAEFMTTFGWDVLAPDQPGHGLTKGFKTHAKLLAPDETLKIFNGLMPKLLQTPEVGEGSYFLKAPKILCGHSMGALLSALWLCAENPPMEGFEWKSAFLAAPPIRLRMKVPAWKLALATGLEKIAPDLIIGNEIDTAFLSIDAANRAEYDADPLVHGNASPRLFWGIRRGADRVMARARMIEVPLCLAVAKHDPVVEADAVREFFDRVNTHKKYLEFPISKHEIFNDVEKKLVYDAFLKWCSQ
ncbi:MAG TPA: alpha/beta fold hydrolase [Bdellovibrionota bacterium]|jgi:lysophospholipase|nr:alpha/beta fold hydrolase [Bdellovibrionota bacterium]